MSFIGVLETVGKGFAKGFSWAVSYAIPVEKLAGLLFPGFQAASTGIASATTLIQNAILMVEQKYAAAGTAKGTGTQKLQEVILLTGEAVTSLLEKAGLSADTGYIESLVSAVVALLNVQHQETGTQQAS